MTNELPPLDRLLMVAEWLGAHADVLDMAEANEEVLREVYCALNTPRGEPREYIELADDAERILYLTADLPDMPAEATKLAKKLSSRLHFLGTRQVPAELEEN